ncbi:hypothetical protein HDIA_1975 [Hartmannibacter diazotrophicus]|uniref:Uncharacterized protein n=2 Tax=Hartmannibacter diazotrophicus TaxID=1482074 RepID=A0A2C9D5F3_9HYPH|nr:hypothetical protein HDIA_1975 [Hartmannibacter diazotrophicus]
MSLLGLLAFWLFILFAAALQWTAFHDGMELWFGLSISMATVAFAIFYLFGLSIFAAPVVFYGAYVAWGWPWYQAVLLAAPAVVITSILLRFRGIKGVFSRV